MKMRTLAGLAVLVITGSLATPVSAQPITLESCNAPNNVYVVNATPGTAGVQGTDYVLGTYLAGGNNLKGHGFRNALAFHSNHFCGAAEATCFVSGPPAFTNSGALLDVDHNWLQGTTLPIVVDVGAATLSISLGVQPMWGKNIPAVLR